MRITSIKLHGVKGIERTFACDHVTVFSGPNGTGKTTAVSAVAWALSGRFPGVGEKWQTMAPLVRADGMFGVTLETDTGVVIKRAFSAQHKALLQVQDVAEKLTGTKAEDRLARMFGDVEFFANALDPERSVWRLSADKFQAWVFALCGSAAAWTPQKLAQAVGSFSADWNPSLHRDPATCLAMNLQAVGESLLAAQRITRESEVTASTITSIQEVTEADVEAARASRDDAQRTLDALVAASRDPEPIKPADPSVSRDVLSDLQMTLLATDAELASAQARASALHDQLVAARTRLGMLGSAAAHGGDDHKCPVCSSIPNDPNWLAAVLRAAQDEVARLDQAAAAVQVDVRRLAREQEEVASHVQTAKRMWERYDVDIAAYDANVKGWRARNTNRPSVVTDATIREAQMRLRVATDALRITEDAWSKMREVELHKDAVTRSKQREDALKALRQRLREVRAELVRDATDPLRAALGSLGSLAPNGCRFDVQFDGDFVQVGLLRGDSTFIAYPAMSGAERLRATIALYAAQRAIRPQPWTGLFVDALEQVYSPEERLKVVETLSRASDINNIFVAGAIGDHADLPGVAWHRLGKDGDV